MQSQDRVANILQHDKMRSSVISTVAQMIAIIKLHEELLLLGPLS